MFYYSLEAVIVDNSMKKIINVNYISQNNITSALSLLENSFISDCRKYYKILGFFHEYERTFNKWRPIFKGFLQTYHICVMLCNINQICFLKCAQLLFKRTWGILTPTILNPLLDLMQQNMIIVFCLFCKNYLSFHICIFCVCW